MFRWTLGSLQHNEKDSWTTPPKSQNCHWQQGCHRLCGCWVEGLLSLPSSCSAEIRPTLLTPQALIPARTEDFCETTPVWLSRGLLQGRQGWQVKCSLLRGAESCFQHPALPCSRGWVTGTHPLAVGRHLRHLWGRKTSQEHCSECSGCQQGEMDAALAREAVSLGTGNFLLAIWKPVLCKIV